MDVGKLRGFTLVDLVGGAWVRSGSSLVVASSLGGARSNVA